MRKIKLADAWVVYNMTIPRQARRRCGRCASRGEWEAMELERPGYHGLVKAGIKSEAEAEALAPQPDRLQTPPKAEATARGKTGIKRVGGQPTAARPRRPVGPSRA